MASEKQPRRDIRQPILIVYVGFCVLAVVVTVVIAFSEAAAPAQAAPSTPTATRTLSPAVLTLQADEPEHVGGQRGQGRGSDVMLTVTAPATPRATLASLTDLSEGH